MQKKPDNHDELFDFFARKAGEVGMINNIDERKECPMRHENGNCLVIGGFCIDGVSDEICHGLHEAYDKGYRDGKGETNMNIKVPETCSNCVAAEEHCGKSMWLNKPVSEPERKDKDTYTFREVCEIAGITAEDLENAHMPEMN